MLYSNLTKELNTLTGNVHTRLIWMSHNTETDVVQMVGYDSKAQSHSIIIDDAKGCSVPRLTTGGHVVVYSKEGKTFACNWDGSNNRLIAQGHCDDTWMDKEGKSWAIVHNKTISRYNIDDPSECIPIVTEDIDTGAWFSMSEDGTYAVAFMPWPISG